MKKLIVMLDLNYTLVGNSQSSNTRRDLPYSSRIAIETYREKLIEMLRGHHVVLTTIRHDRYREQTLERIKKLTGWEPDEAYFCDREGWAPARWKAHVLATVKAKYPDAQYVAVESNEDNAAMYVQAGVLVLKVWGGQHRGNTPQKSLFN